MFLERWVNINISGNFYLAVWSVSAFSLPRETKGGGKATGAAWITADIGFYIRYTDSLISTYPNFTVHRYGSRKYFHPVVFYKFSRNNNLRNIHNIYYRILVPKIWNHFFFSTVYTRNYIYINFNT